MKTTRRTLLISAAGAASAVAVGASGGLASAASPPAEPAPAPRKRTVVVCGGHPGDPENGCGGTIARLTALGHEVVLRRRGPARS